MEGDEIAMISNNCSNICNNIIGGGKDQEDHQVGNIVKIQQENHVKGVMRAWRVFKRVSCRFVMRRRKKVAAARRAVVACVWKIKRKVCRILLGGESMKKKQNVLLSYDMCSYSKNFDDGNWQNEEIEFFRTKSFSFRYANNPNSLAF